ncbi:MAG: hypothetical protein ACKN9T_06830 [Candidatus Methylumidiphilus sp.]
MNGVSALILTLNEEINIGAYLDTVSWSYNVAVLDSFISHQGMAIATAKVARVMHRKFDNWPSHQSWSAQNILSKHPWVLYLDADERCPPELAQKIQASSSIESKHAAYRIRRKDFFMGAWLKHAQLYPTWLARLFRPENISYPRLVNRLPIY